MLDHTTITVKNYHTSKVFFTEIFATCGYKNIYEFNDSFCGFGFERCEFWIASEDEKHPHSSNLHLAIKAHSKDEVDMFYNVAIKNGGKDNGAPGYREHYGQGYYAAFVLDEDGNNLEAVFREKIIYDNSN